MAKCGNCNGGACPSCNGSGDNGGGQASCGTCHGSGKCGYCNGNGYD